MTGWPYLAGPVQAGGAAPVNDAFQILIKTDNAGISSSTSIALPVNGTFDVDWGDPNDPGDETITGATYSSPTYHDYGVVGNYVVKISPGLTRVRFAGGGDRLKLLEIQNFGDVALTSLASAFESCINLNITATDTARFFTNNQGLSWGSAFKSSLVGTDKWANFPIGGAGLVLGAGEHIAIFYSSTGFNHSLGQAVITGVTNLSYSFENSGVSAENWSKTLIGLANQVSANGGPINVNAANQYGRKYNSTNYGGSPFNNAVDARAYLVLATGSGGAGWTITGDAQV